MPGKAESASWRLSGGKPLLRVDWERDSALFSPLTGQTHLLGPLPVELLHLLESGPATSERLAEALAAACEVENTPRWRARVQQMLQELADLSLVEPCGK